MRHEREYLIARARGREWRAPDGGARPGDLAQDALEEAQGVRDLGHLRSPNGHDAVPPHLQERLASFIAEEVVSSLRHSVVNDLTALAALCYRLKIEHTSDLGPTSASRSAHELLENIQAYVEAGQPAARADVLAGVAALDGHRRCSSRHWGPRRADAGARRCRGPGPDVDIGAAARSSWTGRSSSWRWRACSRTPMSRRWRGRRAREPSLRGGAAARPS